jgi:DNA-binding response OmpR family regulator
MSAIFLLSKDQGVCKALREAILNEKCCDHNLVCAETFEALCEQLRNYEVALIVLDAASFSEDSELLCRRVRAVPRAAQAALLCIANGGARVVAQLLDAGADDCLRRATLNSRELAARLRALLRRQGRQTNVAPLVICARERSIRLNGRSIELTPTEFNLLNALSQRPGEYLSAAELLERVWDLPNGDPALVRNHMRNLRRKLESDPERPRLLISAHGRGYALSVDPQRC